MIASMALGNISGNGVNTSNELFPKCVPGEVIPTNDLFPNGLTDTHGLAVDFKIIDVHLFILTRDS